jgi:hypothetical protein
VSAISALYLLANGAGLPRCSRRWSSSLLSGYRYSSSASRRAVISLRWLATPAALTPSGRGIAGLTAQDRRRDMPRAATRSPRRPGRGGAGVCPRSPQLTWRCGPEEPPAQPGRPWSARCCDGMSTPTSPRTWPRGARRQRVGGHHFAGDRRRGRRDRGLAVTACLHGLSGILLRFCAKRQLEDGRRLSRREFIWGYLTANRSRIAVTRALGALRQVDSLPIPWDAAAGLGIVVHRQLVVVPGKKQRVGLSRIGPHPQTHGQRVVAEAMPDRPVCPSRESSPRGRR